MSTQDDRLREELQFHLEQQIAKNIRNGMSPAEARRDALVRFGGVEPIKEATRDQFRGAWVADFLRDMRVAARSLTRVPSWSITVILTLTLGIGAAAAMFSVYEGVLLRGLPYPEADRIVYLYQLSDAGNRNRVSDPNYEDWRAGTTSFKWMAPFTAWGEIPIAGAGEAQLARVTFVGREFFDVMGVVPALGRAFTDEEQQVGGPAVAVVSRSFWRRWKGDKQPNGEVLRSGSEAFTVVGVMPDGFDFPGQTAIWAARDREAPNRSRTSHNALVVARLADGVSLERARREISTLSRQLKVTHGERTWMSDADAVPVLEVLTGTSRGTLTMLLAAALLLLVVAGTNVSNLLLTRAAARQSEFAVQLALGATTGRLARQLLAETLVICFTGAAFGILVAMLAVRLFVAAGPAGVARLDTVTVSWPAVAFAVVASIVVACVLTLITALGAGRLRIADAVSAGARSGGSSRAQWRLREGLVVVQVALTLVLVAGAALLGRSLLMVLSVNPGYSLDAGLVVGITSPSDGSPESLARQVNFQETVLERVRRLPGVERAGLVTNFPIGVASSRNGSYLEMLRPDEITSFDQIDFTSPVFKPRIGSAEYRHVSGDYFAAMGIPVIDGRAIDERDGPGAPHAAVVSRALAEQRWPGRSALGRWIQFGNMDGDLRPLLVVGVVGDVRELSPESAPEPMIYVAARQRPRQASRAWVILRGPGAEAQAEAVRRLVADVDPETPAITTTVAEAMARALGTRRFTVWLVTAFGATALALAVVGIYGLFAFVVSRRTREMGIRLALGAEPRSLVWLIVRRALAISALGIVIGLTTALVAGRAVADLLYGVTPGDPVTLAGACAAMLAVAALASYAPARRILTQAPATTLRDV